MAAIWAFSPPVSSARAFSMAVTWSSNLARVSATGLSWASRRALASSSCDLKVSEARSTSVSATASADWAAWALSSSALEPCCASASRSLSSARARAVRAAAELQVGVERRSGEGERQDGEHEHGSVHAPFATITRPRPEGSAAAQVRFAPLPP